MEETVERGCGKGTVAKRLWQRDCGKGVTRGQALCHTPRTPERLPAARTEKLMNREEAYMKIWIARHGQTDLNKNRRMQGLTDCPLNEKGIAQARQSRLNIGEVRFDAVYASPLQRARLTGAIIAGVDISEVIVDRRLIEVDFGKYERRKYYLMGPAMTAYWAMPRLFPAPPTVETIASMKDRAASFLRELETKDYENVLVACHGGIMRALCGYLDEAPDGLHWERAKNCEIRVYEDRDGRHSFLKSSSLGT